MNNAYVPQPDDLVVAYNKPGQFTVNTVDQPTQAAMLGRMDGNDLFLTRPVPFAHLHLVKKAG
jgi:hypothetical protein